MGADDEKQASDDHVVQSCSSSDEVAEDASSTSSSSLSSSSSSFSGHARGPLYGLSELMAQLPIKRGLSKFYDGKSQSFSCLTSVRSIEDLRKPDDDRSKRLKLSKSYDDDLDRRPSMAVVIPKEMKMKMKKKKKKACSSLQRASYLRT